MSIIPTMERLKEDFKIHPSELIIGGSAVTFDFEDLDEFYTEKAERELRETPEVTEEALKILLDLLAEEEDLFVPMEKEFLQMFLRRCKWYPDSAFRLIKEYYKYKRRHPEFYNDYLPSKVNSFLNSGVFIPLPVRTAEGERVVIFQSAYWNTNELSLQQLYSGLLMFIDIAASEVRTQVAGAHIIIDVGSLSLRHVTQFTPWFAKAVVDFTVKCAPARLKGVHIINNPYFFLLIFALFRPFLNAKIRDRVFIHGDDRASILKHIDAKALPRQFGGEFDLPDEPIREPLNTYTSVYEDFFIEINRYGYVTEI